MSLKKNSLFYCFYIFILFVLLSFQSYAGGDPDEFAQEEEQVIQNSTKIEQKDSAHNNQKDFQSSENISSIIGSCLSFPEAIAYKEHFACLADQEKNRVARINWSFSKLLLR
tara:strand:+ start:118 stop:453 length:336 start_codon:yes stop_codon:yes gene_type:complete